MASQRDPRNLIIVADATGSMGSFLSSIAGSIQQFISVMKLTGGFDRVRLLSYYDYCDCEATRCSEWATSLDQLENFVKSLSPCGGGDWPEAAKTAAYEVLGWVKGDKPGATTTVIWYADAPPHHQKTKGSNFHKERAFLGEEASDWVWLCKQLGKYGATVYPLINTPDFDTASFYALMADITGGQALYIHDTSPKNITKVTVNLVVGIMGCECDLGETTTQLTFPNLPVDKIQNENAGNMGYLVGFNGQQQQSLTEVNHVTIAPVDKLKSDLTLAGRRVDADVAYRDMVYTEFQRLVTPDAVLSLTYNSVFGALWRAICRQRKDERTEQLLLALDDVLNKLDADSAQQLRKWLEASYDRVAEVRAQLSQHTGPAFPALMLDRPVHMGPAPTTQELLELARSCHPSVLTRVGSLLTCLRLAKDAPAVRTATPTTGNSTAHEAPPAIADDDSNPFTPQYLPLSLPDRELFSLLPHLLAPGTVFSRRPAIILASLAVLHNTPVLADRARAYLAENCGKWFDLEQAENYSMDLARIMIQVQRELHNMGHPPALTPEEHRFFTLLARLGGLTINAHTSLLLTQPCTPFKLLRPDRKHACNQCHTPRSFTLTTPSGACGLCVSDCSLSPDGTPVPEPHPERSHWCECRTCQGQYAVVRIDLMNVGPKCYFCRNGLAPPLRQCRECTNKFVDPCLEAADASTGIQPADDTSSSTWVCPSCEAKPGSSLESVAVELCDLVVAQPGPLLAHLLGLDVPSGVDVFRSRSLFKLVTAVGVKWLEGRDNFYTGGHDENGTSGPGKAQSQPPVHISNQNAVKGAVVPAEYVCDKVEAGLSNGHHNGPAGGHDVVVEEGGKRHGDEDVAAIPAADGLIAAAGWPDAVGPLEYNRKQVLNTADVCAQILTWVGSGKAERGTCMLCYQDMSKKQLQGSCGRRNCQAVACSDCLSAWYGEPRPGQVISLANFLCPFCKCLATTKTLQRFNKLACALKGRTGSDFLADPTWFYAWCTGCYLAKQCMAKTCAVELHQLPTNFQCEECEVAVATQAAAALHLAPDANPLLAKAKPCPKCGHGVVKTSGCDHITCVCGEHWCWQCGEGGFDEYSVYGHIGSQHNEEGLLGYDAEMEDEE